MSVTAVLLAAGKGERLWPLTSTRPKPLLPILCKPLIQYHLEALEEIGVRETVVVLQYMGGEIEKAIEKMRLNAQVKTVYQGKPLGTGHAVGKALEKIESDKVLIIYSDVFVDKQKYPDLLRRLVNSEENMLVGARVNESSRYGLLLLDKKGNLRGVAEKDPKHRGGGLVNSGIMFLSKDLLSESLKKTGFSERGEIELTDALTLMASETDVKIRELKEGDWTDIGTPWDYLETNKKMLEKECMARGADIGECVLGTGYELRDPVVIEPPVYIGEDSLVGPFAHIRSYTIACSGVKIGFSTQVKASVLLEGAKLPHLNYVGDSIVGEHSNLGAGTITANLRHDGKTVKTMIKGKLVDTGLRKFGSVIGGYAKTGINTSIAPGVKIGAWAWIDSGCTIKRDVPDRTVVKCPSNTLLEERLHDLKKESG